VIDIWNALTPSVVGAIHPSTHSREIWMNFEKTWTLKASFSAHSPPGSKIQDRDRVCAVVLHNDNVVAKVTQRKMVL